MTRYSVNSLLIFVATPADVSMLMQLGVDGVFVGSGIFKSSRPEKRAKAMVKAVTYYNDPKALAELSEDLGEPMVGHSVCSFTRGTFTSEKKSFVAARVLLYLT